MSEVVPLLQVTDGVPVEWEDPISGRCNRRRTITVQANPIQGTTLPTLRDEVLEDFDAIETSCPARHLSRRSRCPSAPPSYHRRFQALVHRPLAWGRSAFGSHQTASWPTRAVGLDAV